jgi:glucose-6-phosphate isomerase
MLVGVNAYHQPGVEAGKKAATRVLTLQGDILKVLFAEGEKGVMLEDLCARVQAKDDAVWFLIERLVAEKRVSFSGAWGSKEGRTRLV